MKVCILYTDFGEFNSTTTKIYFTQKKIKRKTATPYSQSQNGLVKQNIQITIKKAPIIMIDSGLTLHP